MKRIKLVAVIAAIIAGVGIYQLLKDISKPQEVPRTQVVVALKDIPKNKVVTEEMVTLRAVATEALLPNVIKDPESIIGKVLSSNVYEGEQITVNRIVQEDQTENLSYRITPGMRAMSLAVSQISGVAFMIKPENRVDVVMTYTKEVPKSGKKADTRPEETAEENTAVNQTAAEKSTTANKNLPEDDIDDETEDDTEIITYSRYLLQNVRVLAVDAVMSEKGATEYVTVTMEVTPEDVLKVTNVDSQYRIRLVLRNGLDTDIQETYDVDITTITGKEATP